MEHFRIAVLISGGGTTLRNFIEKIDGGELPVEIALVRWLNLLLGLSHEHGLVFSRFWIERDGVNWRGGASGEPWRRDLERGTEVKGATLTMLQVREERDGWRARCVVDV